MKINDHARVVSGQHKGREGKIICVGQNAVTLVDDDSRAFVVRKDVVEAVVEEKAPVS